MIIRESGIVADQSSRVSLQGYLRYINEHQEEGRFFDLVDGYIIPLPLFTRQQAQIVTRLYARLNYHIDTHQGGQVFEPRTRYHLTLTTALHPVLTYISEQSLRRDDHDPMGYTPDLVIDFAMMTQTPADVRQIAERYLKHGVQAVWMIFSDDHCAELYTLEDGKMIIEELGMGDTLCAPDILPEFELPLYFILPSTDIR